MSIFRLRLSLFFTVLLLGSQSFLLILSLRGKYKLLFNTNLWLTLSDFCWVAACRSETAGCMPPWIGTALCRWACTGSPSIWRGDEWIHRRWSWRRRADTRWSWCVRISMNSYFLPNYLIRHTFGKNFTDKNSKVPVALAGGGDFFRKPNCMFHFRPIVISLIIPCWKVFFVVVVKRKMCVPGQYSFLFNSNSGFCYFKLLFLLNKRSNFWPFLKINDKLLRKISLR